MTKSKLHSTLLATAMVAGGMIVGAGSAYAVPGTIFTGTDSLLFTVGSESPDPGPGSFVSVTTTELQWIDSNDATAPNDYSYLRILPPTNVPVNITSDAGWVPIAQLEHENNVIPGVFNFTIGMSDLYQLSGATFDVSGTDTLPNVPLVVSFTETLNATTCPAPNPVGSVCDDVWQITGLENVLGSFMFTDILGDRYNLTFSILPELDSGTALIGNTIYTEEGETSNIFVLARIDSVPEPGSLALLGIGLLGLPLVARRAAKKA